jgi:hypothetical protein
MQNLHQPIESEIEEDSEFQPQAESLTDDDLENAIRESLASQ